MISTLINNKLLSEQLQASLNYERTKLRIKDLQRAERYLRAAGEASVRYANRVKMIQEYDDADERGLAWTLVDSKIDLMMQAVRISNRYRYFMDWHHQILLKLLTK